MSTPTLSRVLFHEYKYTEMYSNSIVVVEYFFMSTNTENGLEYEYEYSNSIVVGEYFFMSTSTEMYSNSIVVVEYFFMSQIQKTDLSTSMSTPTL